MGLGNGADITFVAVRRVRGTRDLLYEDSRHQRFVEDQLESVAQSFGFHEIRTPLLEHTELFSRSVGEASDIVSKEMFTFPASSTEKLPVSIRPEGTAGIVRALVEARGYASTCCVCA